MRPLRRLIPVALHFLDAYLHLRDKLFCPLLLALQVPLEEEPPLDFYAQRVLKVVLLPQQQVQGRGR